MTFPCRASQSGRKANTASASPICTSSKSPFTPSPPSHRMSTLVVTSTAIATTTRPPRTARKCASRMITGSRGRMAYEAFSGGMAKVDLPRRDEARQDQAAVSCFLIAARIESSSFPPSRPRSFVVFSQFSITGSVAFCQRAASSVVERDDRIAASLDHLGDDDRLLVPDLAGHGGGRHSRIGVDHRLEVGRQRLVFRLVHGENEGRRVEGRRARNLGVVLDELVHLDRGHDFPGHDGAVDDALRERFGHLRDRHADRADAQRRAAPRRQAASGSAASVPSCPRASSPACWRGRARGRAPRSRSDAPRLNSSFMFAVGEFLKGERVHDRLAVRDEGQLEGLADREAAGRVARAASRRCPRRRREPGRRAAAARRRAASTGRCRS